MITIAHVIAVRSHPTHEIVEKYIPLDDLTTVVPKLSFRYETVFIFRTFRGDIRETEAKP